MTEHTHAHMLVNTPVHTQVYIHMCIHQPNLYVTWHTHTRTHACAHVCAPTVYLSIHVLTPIIDICYIIYTCSHAGDAVQLPKCKSKESRSIAYVLLRTLAAHSTDGLSTLIQVIVHMCRYMCVNMYIHVCLYMHARHCIYPAADPCCALYWWPQHTHTGTIYICACIYISLHNIRM